MLFNNFLEIKDITIQNMKNNRTKFDLWIDSLVWVGLGWFGLASCC
jgi:hypothetical protein